jgi:hypothetical protein
MKPLRIPFVVALLAVVGSVGSPARLTSAPRLDDVPAWSEASWPFLLDQWGLGRAFECAANCGAGTRLFVRAKRGFCNCLSGIADDDELDRLTDFDFFGGPPRPLGQGWPVRIGKMAGRARSFAIEAATHRRAISLAVATDCDAVVAVAMSDSEHWSAVEPTVLALLARIRLADLDETRR